MSLKRQHTLYLQSKHRTTGTTSQYTITLPNFIQSDPNLELFKISLFAFSTYNTMLQVKEGRDTINVNGTNYNIGHGTYTYQKLARTIQSIINTPVVWNVELNIMTFVFESSSSIHFDKLGEILGFDADIIYTGSQISSSRAMRPIEPTHIIIHLNNVSPVEDHLNLSNHTGEVRVSNILAKVLINSAPFQLVTYQQVLESDALYTGDNTMQTLEIYITDNDGNEIDDLPEHEMVLKIESVDIENNGEKEMIRELKEIKNTLKDIFIQRALMSRWQR